MSEHKHGHYDSEATGPLAGTGAGRTARKADSGAGFHPATRPNSSKDASWPEGGLPHGEHPHDYGYDPLTEEGGVNESSSGVHGQQMSPLPSSENDRSGRSSASTSPPAASGLWCEDFDTDLPKVVPDWLDFLGYAAGVELHTHCSPTNGKINCPAAWWTDHGLTAFFATPGTPPAPQGYWTNHPRVDCTFAEVVRDEWIHGCVVVVNQRLVWKPPNTLMERLMFDVRGWTVLDDIERADIKRNVRRSIAGAAERLLEVTS